MSESLVENKTHRTQEALFFIGFGSIISQILLVREFLVSFYGNELSIGIIFAMWLIWISIGSAAGNKVVKKRQKITGLFFLLIVLTPVITCIQILCVKFIRAFSHAAIGEFLSMAELLGFSCVILSVGCSLWGMLFTLGAKSLSPTKEHLWHGVNKAYVLESFGSVIGGLLFSFIMVPLISTFQMLFLLVLMGWGVTLWSLSSRSSRLSLLFSIILVLVYIVLLRPLQFLEHQINTSQWSVINDKLTFIRSMDTKYQNLSLLRIDNQFTVYTNGRPSSNIPSTYDAEIFTHSILIHRSDAKRVLLLGGGFNGLLREILKYPIEEIEYVEIDPALLPFVEPVLDTMNLHALHDPRVRIIATDGRKYLRDSNKFYDVILLNIGEPSTASMNRYFTLEFYQRCASRLTAEGILAFSFPSSAEYLTGELKDLNASMYYTFKLVFQNVLMIPGDHAVMIGTRSKKEFMQNTDSLAHRSMAAGISTEYFTRYTFEGRMPSDRIKYIVNTLESVQNYRVNTDTHPVTYYFDLLLWNRFLHGDNSFILSMTRFRVYLAGILTVGMLFLIVLLQRRYKENQQRSVLFIIMASGGMIGMALNLLLFLNFQETFGSIYEMLGAMSAAFMFGLAAGAMLSVPLAKKYKSRLSLVFVLLTLLSIVLLLPQILYFLTQVHSILITLAAAVFCGMLIGLLFGIVNYSSSRLSTGPGSIYASDVLGSSAGALITCSILLPVLGLQELTYFLSIFIILSFVLLVFIPKTE